MRIRGIVKRPLPALKRKLGRWAFPLGGAFAAVVLAGLTAACGTSDESGGSTNASPESATSEPVQTDAGLVSGVPGQQDASITVFKGIPYAAPPTGDLRWRPPQPPDSWEGVRKADTFGDICPQGQPPEGGTLPPMSEDCLNLNVWTGATSANEKRPVYVWIYGGRFAAGSGSYPLFAGGSFARNGYDGEGLASKGMVVVTFNYRNGVFGFLSTPELSQESGHNASGNYGLLDQVAALQWVKNNIAAFGGDPNNVTIAGQSAGAASVLDQVNSPLSKGLFERAIAESGARYPHDPDISTLATSYRSLEDTESEGEKYAEQHNASSLKELRALSVDDLLKGSDVNDENVSGPPQPLGNPPPPLFRPVLDGWVIPTTYDQTLANGSQNDVPIMTGNNLDENGASPQPDVKLADYQSAAKQRYGAMADEFLKLYPASSDQEAGQATNDSIRDSSRVSTYLWSEEWAKKAKSPVFTYFWTHAPPGPDHDKQGAYHGSEINYMFDNLYGTDRPWTDEDRQIADTMSNYVVNFATSGDPNGDDLPSWAASDPGSSTTMEVGDNFGPISVADETKLDFIKRFFDTQKAW